MLLHVEPCRGTHLASGPVLYPWTYSYLGVRHSKVRRELVVININWRIEILWLSGQKQRITWRELALATQPWLLSVWFFLLSYLYVLSCPLSAPEGQNNSQHLHKTSCDCFKRIVFAAVYICSPGSQAEFHKDDLLQALFPRTPCHAALWGYWAAPFFGWRPVSLTSMFALQPEHLE